MSVPHLDTRFVEGRRSLMFGPYAGFSTNFLQQGSYLDLPFSVRPHNLLPMMQVGMDNTGLVSYLMKEVTKSHKQKVEQLRDFYPDAEGEGWELVHAGQRVQMMKKDAKGRGVLQFGTELVTGGPIGVLLLPVKAEGRAVMVTGPGIGSQHLLLEADPPGLNTSGHRDKYGKFEGAGGGEYLRG